MTELLLFLSKLIEVSLRVAADAGAGKITPEEGLARVRAFRDGPASIDALAAATPWKSEDEPTKP